MSGCRVFDNADLLFKMVTISNAHILSMVSRTACNVVRQFERDVLVEYIHSHQFLDCFPVPCFEVNKQSAWFSPEGELCFYLVCTWVGLREEYAVHRHEMQITVTGEEPSVLKLRVISSKADEEDGHGRFFQAHTSITSCWMLRSVLQSLCWHPNFNGPMHPAMDVMVQEHVWGEHPNEDCAWEIISDFMQRCCLRGGTVRDVQRFRCEVKGNEIFMTFMTGRHSFFHEGYLTFSDGDDSGFTFSIKTVGGCKYGVDDFIMTFYNIYSLGRIVHILADEYWYSASHDEYPRMPQNYRGLWSMRTQQTGMLDHGVLH